MDLYLMADGDTSGVTREAQTDRLREETLRRFDEWRDPLRRYLLCAGATPADADDAVQETFLRLHRHLMGNGDLSNLAGWVFQVARNYLRDDRKSARWRRSVTVDGAAGVADPAGSPEHRALGRERLRRLSEAIDGLPQQQRECMLLRSSGLRYREIAEVLGIHISSVGSLVNRATTRLREELS